jgi:hypothetical protein
VVWWVSVRLYALEKFPDRSYGAFPELGIQNTGVVDLLGGTATFAVL